MTLKRHLASLTICSLMVFGPTLALTESAGIGCVKAVDVFLAAPTDQRLRVLSRIDRTGCWTMFAQSNAKLGQLNRLAVSGNRVSAQYLAAHLNQLDGGNLEDSLRAMGEFSEHDMEHFLLFARKGLLSNRELADALTMLPLSLSDNPLGQLHSLRLRKSKVSAVRRKDLSDQTARALTAINEFESEIKSKSPKISEDQT